MKLPGRAVKRPPGANKNRRGDMQYHDNILCVEAGWMIEVGVMSFDNYKQLKCRKDIQILNRGCRNTPALVAYDSMPERFKRKILALVGDPYKAVKTNILETFITPSTEASHFFETHKTGGDSHLPSDKRRQYYADAIILDAMHRMIDDRQARRAALGGKTTRFWEQLSQAAQDIDRTRYPHNLPTNPRSLERKYKDYMKNGYEALIHSAYKNPTANAAKVFTEEQIGVMVTVMGDPRKYDDAQCAEWYNAIAKVRNESNPDSEQWKPITRSTVSVWRRKLASTILARRNGDIEFMNTLTMQVKRRAPKHPLLYWTLDGWNAELLYQSVRNGRTIYHERLAIEVVLDACTKYPIGYAIGTHENPDLIRAALRNAARHTEELFGQMYRTAQIQSDRYQITQMTPTYAAISEIVTPAQAHNAKAKIIEPWFKYFNKKYCQPQKNWSGYGITSRRELQPNSSFLNKYRGEFPTMEQLVVELADMINTERARLRDEYLRRFNAMPTDKLIPMTREDFLLNFGTTTSLKNLMQPSGLHITIGGVKRTYDCFDLDMRDHLDTRWTVRYDPDDLSTALAVNDDETLRFPLEEKYIQPMALAERQPGDAEELAKVREFNKALRQRTAERMGAHEDAVAHLLDGHREYETLSKLLITDSLGQHKDNLSAARIAAAEHDEYEDRTPKITAVKCRKNKPAPPPRPHIEDAQIDDDAPLPPIGTMTNPEFDPSDILDQY